MNVAVPPPTCDHRARAGVAAGITSSRRRCTSSVVAWSCGEVVGIDLDDRGVAGLVRAGAA